MVTAKVSALWDDLVYNFDRGYELEEVAEETRMYLPEFIVMGVRKDQLFRMLGKEGIFYEYEVLAKHGIKVDLINLAEELGKDFAYNHLLDFQPLGADMDELVRSVIDQEFFREVALAESLEGVTMYLLSAGVKATTIFDHLLANYWFADQSERAEWTLFEVQEFLVQSELPKEAILPWLKNKVREHRDLRRFVIKNDEMGAIRPCDFGLDPKEFA